MDTLSHSVCFLVEFKPVQPIYNSSYTICDNFLVKTFRLDTYLSKTYFEPPWEATSVRKQSYARIEN